MINNKKFLVLGSERQLGREFVFEFDKRRLNYIAPKENDCDITNNDQFNDVIDSAAPDIIINCAVYNAVDEAEVNGEVAFLINSEAVLNIAKICKEKSMFLVHYSSEIY